MVADLVPLTSSAHVLRAQDMYEAYGARLGQLWQAKRTGQRMGPTTGFDGFDEELGGWMAPGIYVIHGQPGTGKTAFAAQMSASCGFPALFLSAEMDPIELFRRQLARLTGYQKGHLLTTKRERPAEESDAATTAAQLGNWGVIDARTEVVHAQQISVALTAHRGYAEHALLVIDSLHAWAMSLAADSDATEYEVLNEALVALRSLVQLHGIPIVVLAERNREGLKGGGLGASRGSGRIEYAADVVIDMRVPEDDTGLSGSKTVTLKMVKTRFGIGGREVHFSFYGDTMKFTEHGLTYG